jgi:hypothetical protein
MSRSIIGTAAIAIATTALAVPAALARPAETPPAVAKAAVVEQQRQARLRRNADEFPTRPVIDRPSYPPNAQPTSTPDDPGTSWITIVGIAASLLAIGSVAAITTRTRRTHRTRITA